jgi:WD40 repeat protein
MDFYTPISTSALYVYYSALLLLPECELIKQDIPILNSTPSLIMLRLSRWSSMLQAIGGHTGRVLDLSMSPDGSRLASCASDGTIRLWDPWTGSILTVINSHASSVYSVALFPDGTRVAAGCWKTIHIWNAVTGAPITQLTGHTDWMFGVAISPDASYVASCSSDSTVRVWNSKSEVERRVLSSKNSWAGLRSIIFSADSSKLIAGCAVGFIYIWDAVTGLNINIGKGHSGEVLSLATTRDGLKIFSGSSNTTIRSWNADVTHERGVYRGHTGEATSLALITNDSWLLSGTEDRSMRLWDTKIGEYLYVYTGHSSGVNSIPNFPGDSRACSVSDDGTLGVWDLHARDIHELALKPQALSVNQPESELGLGRLMRTIFHDLYGAFQTLRKRHDEPEAYQEQVPTLANGDIGEFYMSSALSPDGLLLAVGEKDGTICLWSTSSRE